MMCEFHYCHTCKGEILPVVIDDNMETEMCEEGIAVMRKECEVQILKDSEG